MDYRVTDVLGSSLRGRKQSNRLQKRDCFVPRNDGKILTSVPTKREIT